MKCHFDNTNNCKNVVTPQTPDLTCLSKHRMLYITCMTIHTDMSGWTIHN